MKRPAPSIFAPLSFIETSVLRAAITPTKIDVGPSVSASERVALAKAVQVLIARGFLAKTKTGLLATPEGLAALLDTVPIDQLTQIRPDASTSLSKVPRTSATARGPRAREAN